MRKQFTVMVALFLSTMFAFVSCGDDVEDNPVQQQYVWYKFALATEGYEKFYDLTVTYTNLKTGEVITETIGDGKINASDVIDLKKAPKEVQVSFTAQLKQNVAEAIALAQEKGESVPMGYQINCIAACSSNPDGTDMTKTLFNGSRQESISIKADQIGTFVRSYPLLTLADFKSIIEKK